MEKYSVILSAYECSPDHGSEAGLGWNWVMVASEFCMTFWQLCIL